MLHWMILFLAGCATEPAPLVSEPVEPTVDLKAKAPEDGSVTWATLEGLLPEGEPAVPEALGGVFLGQPEAAAREAFEGARHDKLAHPDDRQLGPVTAVAGRLQAFPTVGVTMLLEAGVVAQVDMAIARDEALFLTHRAWGEPDEREVGREGVPRPAWVHAGLRVSVIDVDDNQAILKFAAVE